MIRSASVKEEARVHAAASGMLNAATVTQVLLLRLQWPRPPHNLIAAVLPAALRTLQDAGTAIMTAEPEQQSAALRHLRCASSSWEETHLSQREPHDTLLESQCLFWTKSESITNTLHTRYSRQILLSGSVHAAEWAWCISRHDGGLTFRTYAPCSTVHCTPTVQHWRSVCCRSSTTHPVESSDSIIL